MGVLTLDILTTAAILFAVAAGLMIILGVIKTVLGALLPAPSLSKIGMLFAFIDELSSSRRIRPNCRITPSYVMSYELIPARFPSSPESFGKGRSLVL